MILHHYTIQSNDLRESPRHEVSEEIVAMLTPLLSDGEHLMPMFSGYSFSVLAKGRNARVELRREGKAIILFWVVTDDAELAAMPANLGVTKDLTCPACIVDLLPGLLGDPHVGIWGDFERCFAWAWIAKIRKAQS